MEILNRDNILYCTNKFSVSFLTILILLTCVESNENSLIIICVVSPLAIPFSGLNISCFKDSLARRRRHLHCDAHLAAENKIAISIMT